MAEPDRTIADAERVNARPLCRYCGAKIAKKTTTVRFVRELMTHMKGDQFTSYVIGTPATKAEAQRLVNQSIVSIRHGENPWDMAGGTYVQQASVWDGESYVDRFFCNGGHARDFAYAVCHSNPQLAMPAYHAAVAAITKEPSNG